MPSFIASLWMVLIAVTISTSVSLKGNARVERARQHEADVREVAKAVYDYVDKFGVVPTSLAVVAAQPGYAYVNQFITQPGIGYAVSPVLNDGNWQYQRVAVYAQPLSHITSDADYLSAARNSCGTGDFATADSWCGDHLSKWYRLETRERFTSLIERQRLRQKATVSKLAVHYNDAGQFDTVPGNVATLASLVGYGGTAANCTGVYRWSNVPLDCNDLFSIFGTPVTVNYHTSQSVSLISRTPIINAAGVAITVGSDISLDLF
jgi:hypothetical protein